MKGHKIAQIEIMKDRIKKIMTDKNLTQLSFSNLTGISTATLSNIFNGKTKPTLAHVEAIKRTFPAINTDWLLYGTLPEFNNADDVRSVSSSSSDSPSSSSQQDSPMLDFGTAAPASASVVGTGEDAVGTTSVNGQGGDGYCADLFAQTSRTPVQTEIKYIDKKPRRITEIRIFYDDQTWETFVPKK